MIGAEEDFDVFDVGEMVVALVVRHHHPVCVMEMSLSSPISLYLVILSEGWLEARCCPLQHIYENFLRV